VEAMLRHANAFTHAAAEQGLTLPELAIKYVLSHDVGSAIIGHRTREEITRNIDAANGRYLSPALLGSIARIQQKTRLFASGLRHEVIRKL
jgi:aryl-alcohol dehydrogenase-like predicted oxidoreductase